MNVVVNGLMTNYQKVGKGKVIICLPGWGDTAATFSKLIEELQDQYIIYSLDLPGFGGTQAPPNAWGLQDYAEFVAAWLEKLGIKKVNAVIGHSYGGAVAITALGSNILKSDRLILVASAGIRSERSKRKAVLKGVAKMGKVPLKLLPRQTQNKIRAKFYKNIGSELMLLPHMELTFRRMISEDVRTAAGNITIPTLLIYGTKDRDTPLRHGQLLKEAINNSRLEIVEGAGHFLHQEQPEQMAKLIEDFVERPGNDS